MPKIVIYQTKPVWFVKNKYFMAKIDVYRSLLPSDCVIGWDMKMTSHPNSNASFINIWDRLIWWRSPNLTRSSKLAAAPNWWFKAYVWHRVNITQCAKIGMVSVYEDPSKTCWPVFIYQLVYIPLPHKSVRTARQCDPSVFCGFSSICWYILKFKMAISRNNTITVSLFSTLKRKKRKFCNQHLAFQNTHESW